MEMINAVVAAGRITNKGLWRTGGGRGAAVDICGEEGCSRATERSDRTNECSRRAREHLGAVKGKWLRAEEAGAAGVKHVHAHVISIGPDTELRVIKEIRAKMEAVTIVTSGGI